MRTLVSLWFVSLSFEALALALLIGFPLDGLGSAKPVTSEEVQQLASPDAQLPFNAGCDRGRLDRRWQLDRKPSSATASAPSFSSKERRPHRRGSSLRGGEIALGDNDYRGPHSPAAPDAFTIAPSFSLFSLDLSGARTHRVRVVRRGLRRQRAPSSTMCA